MNDLIEHRSIDFQRIKKNLGLIPNINSDQRLTKQEKQKMKYENRLSSSFSENSWNWVVRALNMADIQIDFLVKFSFYQIFCSICWRERGETEKVREKMRCLQVSCAFNIRRFQTWFKNAIMVRIGVFTKCINLDCFDVFSINWSVFVFNVVHTTLWDEIFFLFFCNKSAFAKTDTIPTYIGLFSSVYKLVKSVCFFLFSQTLWKEK